MVVLDQVREQYEELPYPPRNPEDERERLVSNQPSQLLLANHLFWGGLRAIDSTLRVLDAGCGTGDSTICMAEQLRDTGARVTALDFSSASLDITRQRAGVRGLDNIDYVEAPLEELPRLGVGEFDFALCSGVLHHLASPERGLEALRAVLKPDGGIAVMVYSRYGRAPLYMMQELMRALAPPSLDTGERLRVLKRTMKLLHDDHPLKQTWDQHGTEAAKGDAALFDMFLHAQDRAYTVPGIYEWVEGAELRILTFDAPRTYEPKHYDDRIDVSALPAPQRHAVAELLHARMGRTSSTPRIATTSRPRRPGATMRPPCRAGATSTSPVHASAPCSTASSSACRRAASNSTSASTRSRARFSSASTATRRLARSSTRWTKRCRRRPCRMRRAASRPCSNAPLAPRRRHRREP